MLACKERRRQPQRVGLSIPVMRALVELFTEYAGDDCRKVQDHETGVITGVSFV